MNPRLSQPNTSTLARLSIVFGLSLFAIVAGVFACGENPPITAGPGASSGGEGTSSCATPQMGCPCTPGSVVACGKHFSSDLNFIYCYQGNRTCEPSGVYGDCLDGTVVPKSITSIGTAALGTPGPCSGGNTGPLMVCSGGKRQGDFCTSNADCSAGVKRCAGGPDNGSSCKDDGDCRDPGFCNSFNGACVGGTRATMGCDGNPECPGGTCNIGGGGGAGICTTHVGICKKGPNGGEACDTDADCLGDKCEAGHGMCAGGKKNGKKCKHDDQCKGGGCTGEDAGAPSAIDPCDPYCNMVTDTPTGLDAGPGFGLSDGGFVVGTCGDGKLGGFEECDDGNGTSGDGCSNLCVVEVGFQCPTPGAPCIASTCGNGTKEGAEECDDGNVRPYDGCSPTCQREVQCPGGACIAVCGDGIKFPTEACDDGNVRDGDGCSSTCTIESGATCTTTSPPLPPSINVPVIYRDFRPTTHPDFESYCCGLRTGIPQNTLVGGVPVLNLPMGMVTSAASFAQWYTDTPGINLTSFGSLTLAQIVPGTYQFNAAAPGFFPLNGLGYGNYAATGRNFHFTSEVRYPFTFAGGETLNFTGDDDVFVFINGRLAVDLGGVHAALSGSVTLTPAVATTLGLIVGNTYEIAVFQAERRTTQSNYRLTLQGFNRVRSTCSVPASLMLVRDFEALCPMGTTATWQLFRWKAYMPTGTSIAFRAATADTVAALPATTLPAPTTVPIGTATSANSVPSIWAYDTNAGPPVTPAPVSQRLANPGSTVSKRWLRVFMTFNPTSLSPRLDEWQQLYSCVPNE